MSDQIKTTPGPWHVHPVKAWICPDFAPEMPICQMRWPADDLNESEVQADAHLIAASPLMFQTLESVAETLTIWEAEQGLSETESALLRDVLAALAAAKGETV